MTRNFYLTENHLYWCDGKIIKGYQPFRAIGDIAQKQTDHNSSQKIS